MKLSFFAVVLASFSVSWAIEDSLWQRQQTPDISQVPPCALKCLISLVPQYCGPVWNTTCVCTSIDLVDAMKPCAYAACNITESLRLLKFQKDSCGEKNDKSRQNYFVRQVYTTTFLSALFVSLRCFARYKLGAGMGPDDWSMIAAMCSYVVLSALALTTTKNNFGLHTYYLTTQELTNSLKYFYMEEIFYHLCVMFTRISLPLLYMRVFPAQNHRRVAMALIALVLTSHIAFLLFSIFQCVPFHGNWTNWMYKTPPVKCGDFYKAIFASGGTGVGLDIMILLFPLPILWKLKLALNKRIHLMLLFILGAFVVVCSSARLPTLKHMKGSDDPSWDQQPVAVWSGLECSVGMICGSLPACRSLAAYLFPRLKIILGSNGPSGPSDQEERSWRSGSEGKKKSGITVTTTTTMGSFIQLDDRNGSQVGIPNAVVPANFDQSHHQNGK